MKEAGPWAWFEDNTLAIRTFIWGTFKGVVAEVCEESPANWVGWMDFQGKKQSFRGDTSEDVMGRIDAVLETDGWALRQPHPDFAKEGPQPLQKPVTAERIVSALMKDPRLAMDVQELLSARFAGRG